jgi:hypothetical protein
MTRAKLAMKRGNKKIPAEARIFKNQKPKFMKPFICGLMRPQVLMIRTAAKIDIFSQIQEFFEEKWRFFEKIL